MHLSPRAARASPRASPAARRDAIRVVALLATQSSRRRAPSRRLSAQAARAPAPASAAAAAAAPAAAAAAPAAAASADAPLRDRPPVPTFPPLNSLELLPIVDPDTGLVSDRISAQRQQQEGAEGARSEDEPPAKQQQQQQQGGGGSGGGDLLLPPPPPSLHAFALYDAQRRLQYLGFAAPGNLRLALRALVGRRPDRAHYYRAADVLAPAEEAAPAPAEAPAAPPSAADADAVADADADADANANTDANEAPPPPPPHQQQQPQMSPTRMAHLVMEAWCAEAGGPPPGNRLALERAAWHSPVSCGGGGGGGGGSGGGGGGAAAQQKGARREAKAAAASAMAEELLALLRAKGCTAEAFEADPLLLAEGQVEWLPPGSTADGARAAALVAAQQAARQAESQAAEQLALKTAADAASASAATSHSLRPRVGVALVDGAPLQFTLSFPFGPAMQTKGGVVLECRLSFDQRDTRHTVVVSRRYYEPFGATPDQAAEVAFALLLESGAEREPPVAGQPLPMDAFPGRYFSLTSLRQFAGDEAFDDAFAALGAAASAAKGGAPGDWGQVGGEPWRFQRLVPRGALALALGREASGAKPVVSAWPDLSPERRREVSVMRGSGTQAAAGGSKGR
jgi:hypothetical protein